MLNTRMFVSLLTAAIVSASSLTIHNQCDKSVTVQIAVPGTAKPDVTIAAGASASGGEGIPQDGNGIALSFVTDPTQTNVAMSRAEVNFTPGDPTGNAFINLSNIYGYSVPVELTGTGCKDYVCNISSGCPVPGPGGSCVSPCCGSLDGCQGGDSCPQGSRPPDIHGGPRPNANFYKGACPNPYAWGDEDTDEPTRDLGSNCSGDAIEITLCTSKPSSNF